MKIRKIGIKGFRGYTDTVEIDIDDLIVLVGRNDIGKSSILEALDIFFNEGKGSIKLDKEDVNKANLALGDDTVEIYVEFEELPTSIVIDATNVTDLADEYLLTNTGRLKIIKRYPNAGKEKVYICAMHPTAAGCADLMLKKNSELKKILEEQNLDCKDRSINSELRKAIWQGQKDLKLEEVEIEVAKIDAKSIWDQLKAHMPIYSLFQADRKNSDGDDEIQDPMRLAVKEILGDPNVKKDLENIAGVVKDRLIRVANQTLVKLHELNPEIASSLDPQIPDVDALKWVDVFKNVAISGDNQIPINKRGSGVKRLILISFFRAEVERRQLEQGLPSVIYAIEEPETSQHPEHQRALVDALIDLSQTHGTQIILTTHSPEIVKRLDFSNLLLIAGRQPRDIRRVKKSELPYPSLNEVNFSAFDESSVEYHNELYGYIEMVGKLEEFKQGQQTRPYERRKSNGTISTTNITLPEYIRHQIHHPENQSNESYTDSELRQSIEAMRSFITNCCRP